MSNTNEINIDELLAGWEPSPEENGSEFNTKGEDGLVKFIGEEDIKTISTAEDAPVEPTIVKPSIEAERDLERHKVLAAKIAKATSDMADNEPGFKMPTVDLGVDFAHLDDPRKFVANSVKKQLEGIAMPKTSIFEAEYADFVEAIPKRTPVDVEQMEGDAYLDLMRETPKVPKTDKLLSKETIRSYFSKDKNGAYVLPNGKKINSEALFEQFVNNYYEQYNHSTLMKDDDHYRSNFFLRTYGQTEEEFKRNFASKMNARLDKIEADYADYLDKKWTTEKMETEAWRNLTSEYTPIRKSDTLRRAIADAREAIASAEKNNYWRGFGETFSWEDIASYGMSGITAAIDELTTLNKYIEGKPLNDQEKLYLDLSMLKQEVAEFRSAYNDRGTFSWNRVGNIVGHMPQFMFELGLTGTAFSSIGKNAAKEITFKAVRDAMKQSTSEGLKIAGKKLGYSMLQDALATPTMAMTYKNLADRRLRRYSWEDSQLLKQEAPLLLDYAKALGETFVERHSEAIGLWITEGMIYGGKALAQAKFLDNAFGKTLRKATSVKVPETIRNIRKTFRIGGYTGEVGSEIYNNLINPLFTGETEAWRQLCTDEYYWELMVSMAIPGVAHYAMAVPAYVGHFRNIKNLRQSTSDLLSGISNQELKELLIDVMSSDKLEAGIPKLTAVDWNNVSAADAQAANRYIFEAVQLKLMESEELETDRLNAFLPVVENVSSSLYSGKNATTPTLGTQLHIAQLKDGKEVFIIHGDMNDAESSTVVARNELGQTEAIKKSDIEAVKVVDMSNYIAEQYNLLFSDSANKERIAGLVSDLRTARENNVSNDIFAQIINNAGFVFFDKREQVTLTDGSIWVVQDHMGGYYKVAPTADSTDSVWVGFLNVLQPDAEIAEAQQELATQIEESGDTDTNADAYTSESSILQQSLQQKAQEMATQGGQTIYTIRLSDGREAFVKQGNIVQNEDGSIDTDSSDATLVIKAVDSADLQQISIDDVEEVIEAAATSEVVAAAQANIEEQIAKKRLISSIFEQYGVVDVILINGQEGKIVELIDGTTYVLNFVGQDNELHSATITLDYIAEVLPPQDPTTPEDSNGGKSSDTTATPAPEGAAPQQGIVNIDEVDWDSLSAEDFLNIHIMEYGPAQTLGLTRGYWKAIRKNLKEALAKVTAQDGVIASLKARFASLTGPAETLQLRKEVAEAEAERDRLQAEAAKIERQIQKYEYTINKLGVDTAEELALITQREQLEAEQQKQDLDEATKAEIDKQIAQNAIAQTEFDKKVEARVDFLEGKKVTTVVKNTAKSSNFVKNTNDNEQTEADIRRDNIPSLQARTDNSSRVDTVNATEASFLEQSGDNISAGRGDIRVFEQGLGGEYSWSAADSERDIRQAVSQRLVEIAQENGLYIPLANTKNLGEKYPGRTGESTVYIDEAASKVYKVKNPYAKSALKKVAPQDAIYEHIVHNLLFPEAPYKFEGISKDVDGVRIVLSQPFIENKGRASQSQIEQALAARGLYPDGRYSYGNDLVSVTDVEGDNVLLGEDGTVHFIDPIIKFKKPALEIIAALQGNNNAVAPMITNTSPKGVTQEKWDAVVGHLEETIGAEDVITDTDQMRQVIESIDAQKGAADSQAAFSIRTYEEGGREKLAQYVGKRVAEGALTEEQGAEILKEMDDIYKICLQYKDKYAPFGQWSEAEVVKDAFGKPVFSVIKKNGDYAMNLDFSLVCKKRRTLDAVFREMIDRGIIDHFTLGQVDVAKINDIIRRYGFETACRLCFVDAKRFRVANVADVFCEMYNPLTELSDKQLKQVIKEEGKKTTRAKIAQMLIEHPENKVKLSRANFMDSKGFENMAIHKESIMKLYNMKKGTGGPKASFGDVQYNNDILGKNWTPEAAYAVGGVRLQSFSDFVPRMVFDYIQMVADLAAKELPVHAYTKEALFAKMFGLTGIKINLSLVPAVVEGGVAAGLDAEGNYVWQEGETFPYEEAIAIQNAEGYKQNCGTIAVGVSDAHITKLLDDENIRMVIPYHKSGLNKAVAIHNNIDQFTDYTDQQNTRRADGTKLSKAQMKSHFDFNSDLRKTGDAKMTAENYLKWCDQKGYIPKFEQFRNHPNYYKLLEDFTTIVTENGVDTSVPQGPVRMNFPTEQSAFGTLSSLIAEGLEEDAVVEGRRSELIGSIVDTIERELQGESLFEDESDLDTYRQLKTSKGEVYGFTYKGKIYLDPNTMSIEAPIHEYTELWSASVAKSNPALWAKGVELIKQTDTWKQVNNDPNYRNLSEDLRASEALSRIVAAEAAKKISEVSDSKTLIAKLRAWIRKFWSELKATFSKWSKEDLSKLTLHEFKNMPFRDFVEGIDPRKGTEHSSDFAASVDAAEVEAIKAERKEIEARAKADGTWLKAPNGKDTNLTPEQWVTVRTRRFKEWFGDWEKAATANYLLGDNVVATLSGNEFAKNDIPLVEKVTQYYADNYDGKIIRNGIGEILLDKRSVKDSRSHGISRIKSAAFAAVPQIIREGVIIDEQTNWKDRKYDSVTIAAPIRIGTDNYIGVVVVKKSKELNRFYLHEVVLQKSLLNGDFQTSLNTGEPSGDIAKVVKNIINAKNNSSKIVDANGEPKVVYNGSKLEHYNYDGRLRSKGQSATNSKVSFFTDRKDVAEKYGGFVNAVFLNIRNPYEVDYDGAGWQGWSGAKDGKQRMSTDTYADMLAGGTYNSTLQDMLKSYGRVEADHLVAGTARDSEKPIDGVVAYNVADPMVGNLYIVRNAEAKDISRERIDNKEAFIRRGLGTLLFDSQIKSVDNVGYFDPNNDDIRYMFLGEQGAASIDAAEEASIRLDNLAAAREMENSGNDALSIKQATGWERGADKMWRYEVPDVVINQATELVEDGEALTTTLGSLVESNDLFSAYPELRDVEVTFKELPPKHYGSFVKGLNDQVGEIILSDEFITKVENPEWVEAMRQMNAHPLVRQWNRVAYAEVFDSAAFDKADQALRRSPIWQEFNALREGNGVIPRYTYKIDGLTTLVHEIQHAIQDKEGFAQGGTPTGLNSRLSNRLNELTEQIKQLRKEGRNAEADEIIKQNKGLAEAVINNENDVLGNYKKLAGEVEARNVAARLNMTAEQRRETLAAETADVAPEDQIFLYNSMESSELDDDNTSTRRPRRSKVEKLQDTITELRNELHDNKKSLKDVLYRVYEFLTSADVLNAMETGVGKSQYRSVLKAVTTAIEQSYGKKDMDVVRQIVDKYLWRAEDIMSRVLAHRLLNELTQILNTTVEGYTPQGVRVGKRIDEKTRNTFKTIRDAIAVSFVEEVEETEKGPRRKPVKYRLKNRTEDGDISTSYRLQTTGRIANIDQQVDDIIANNADNMSATDIDASANLIYIKNVLTAYDATLEINALIGQANEEIEDLDAKIKETSAAHKAAVPYSAEREQLWNNLKAFRCAKEAAVKNRASLRKNYAIRLKAFNLTLEELVKLGVANLKNAEDDKIEKDIAWKVGIYRSIKDPSVKVLPFKEYDEKGKKRNSLKNAIKARSINAVRQRLTTGNYFLATFDMLSKEIDRTSIPGHWLEDGWYYQFMLSDDGYMCRADWRHNEEKRIQKLMEDKVKEIFGDSPLKSKIMAMSSNPLNIIAYEAQKKSGYVIRELAIDTNKEGKIVGGKQTEIALTIGNLLYIRNIARQQGGKAGYVTWGISETKLDYMVAYVEQKYPEYCQFADWVVRELIPQLYEQQDAIYFERFGTHLTKTHDYFPIVRDKRFVGKIAEVGEGEVSLPSSVTSNIIERVMTATKMDLSADMFTVLNNHIKSTLDWIAYSELTRKFNSMSTSYAFRNRMDAQGFPLDQLKQTYEIAIGQGAIDKDSDTFTKAVNSVSKSIVAGNLVFNFNAAIKQLISMTAVLGYTANPKFTLIWAKNYFTPAVVKLGVNKAIQMLKEGTLKPEEALDAKVFFDNWNWALENIPTLRARWESRQAGFEIFKAEGLARWDKVSNYITRIGLAPNAFVDMLTCANGARAIYEYQYAENIKNGMSEEKAHKDARVKAAVFINETQQSGLSAFTSPFQSGGVIARMFGVGFGAYQNTAMSFSRNEWYSFSQIFRMMNKDNRTRMIDFKTEEYRNQGVEYGEARKRAQKEFKLAFWSEANEFLHNAIFSNFAWVLGGYLSSIIGAAFGSMGFDDDEWWWNSDSWNKFWSNEDTRRTFTDIISWSTILYQFPLFYNHPLAKQIMNAYQAYRKGTNYGGIFDSPVSSDLDDLVEAISKQWSGVVDPITGEIKKDEPIRYEQTAEYIVWGYMLKTGLTLNRRVIENITEGIVGAIEDGVDVEDIMNFLSSPRGLTRSIAGEPRKGETTEEYLDRMSYVYRLVNEGSGVYDSKWQRERINEYIQKRERPLYEAMGIDPLEVQALEAHKKAIEKILMLQSSGLRSTVKDAKVQEFLNLPKVKSDSQIEMYKLKRMIDGKERQLKYMVEFDQERSKILKEKYELEKQLYNEWKKYIKL